MGLRRFLSSAVVWLALLSLSGCNAGVGAVLLAIFLDDDDKTGGSASGLVALSSLEFLGLENARSRPSETLIRIRLTNVGGAPTNLVVEYDDMDSESGFRPATLISPLPGEAASERGELNGVPASEAGRLHRVGWDARRDLATDDLRNVRLRFSGDLEEVVLADVVVGNDAPEILELTVRQRSAELAEVTVQLQDTSSDVVDLVVEFATPPLETGESPVFLLATTEGAIELLSTTPERNPKTFLWDSITDLGPLDRPAILRVTPMDRVDGGPGKTGLARQRQIFSNGNRAPVGLLLQDELLTHPDGRRGVPLGFTLEDKESNAVDVILQWEDDAHPFPELPEGLARDPEGREMVFADPAQRAGLQILSLMVERVVGPIEQAADGVILAENELLSSWLLSRGPLRGARVDETLAGRQITLASETSDDVNPGEGDANARRICDYSPSTGVLRLDAPFSSSPEVGESIVITLGGPFGTLRMPTSPESVFHRVIWDAATDAPGGGNFRFRLTPYDRVAVAETDPCGDTIQTDDPQVVRGAVGTTSATAGAKRARGPFRATDPWTVALAPIDTPVAVEAADVDGDGRLDLVYAARLSNAVVILLQTVAGEFEELRILDETLLGPAGLAARDLDGDGDLDIAVIGEDSGTLRVLLQEPGLDFFSNRVLLAASDTLGRPTALVAADFDHNGTADLGVTSIDGELRGVAVFLRGEDGWEPPLRAFLEAGLQPLALEASDIDGDGSLDLAVAGSGFVAVCVQGADGTFSEGMTSIEAPGAELGTVAVADVNRDGSQDILVADRESGAVLAALQTADGGFSVLTGLVPEAELQGPRALATADFNGDGRVDFAVADAGISASALGGEVSVFIAAGNGRFQRDSVRRLPEVGQEAGSPQTLLAVDIDGDGVLELVAGEARVQEIAVYFQGRVGSFRDLAQELVGPPAVSAPASLAAVDLDGDGRKDLFTTHPESAQLTLLRQGVGGHFVALRFPHGGFPHGGFPEAPDTAISGPVAVEAGDVDGDGRADVVVANRDSDSLSVLSEAAEENFVETAVSAPGLLGPQSVALGDLDGDGQLDIVAGGREGGVRWFQQVAGEAAERLNFEVAVESALALPGGVSSERALVKLGDWDGDGLLDVLAIYGDAERFAVFLQSAEESGSFAAPIVVELSMGSEPGALASGDLDGDGRLDAVVAGRGDGSVSVLRQGVDGVPVSAPLIAESDVVATDVVLGDVNQDGRLDVVAALVGAERSSLRLLLQGTESDFSDAGRRDLQSSLTLGPVALVLEDLDGDGELDLASANRLSSNVTAFFAGR